MRVDWDSQKNDPIVDELDVWDRATLIMFKDGKEVARLRSETNKGKIEALFKAIGHP